MDATVTSTVGNLTPGATYSVLVAVKDAAGVEVDSTVVAFTAPAAPGGPVTVSPPVVLPVKPAPAPLPASGAPAVAASPGLVSLAPGTTQGKDF